MRHKIVALTATALKVGLCITPASPEAVAGMETALIALNGVLRRLTYFNATHQVWELTQQLAKELSTSAFQTTEQSQIIHRLKTQLRERTEQQNKSGRIIDRQDIELTAQRRQIEDLQKQLLGHGSGNTIRSKPTQRNR